MPTDNSKYANATTRPVRLLFRTLLALCALAFFVSTVVVSIGPAHPYLKGSTRTSHFSRLNRTSEPGVEGAGKIALSDRPMALLEPGPEHTFCPSWDVPSPKVSRSLRFYYFRPPPLL